VSSTVLPIADRDTVINHARTLIWRHRAALLWMLTLYTGASVAGMVSPWIIGRLVNLTQSGQLTGHEVDTLVTQMAVAMLTSAALTFLARRRIYILGETVFAELREEFLDSVLALPLTTVERAGTGDLLSRTTNDIDAISRTVRFAVPEFLVAIIQAVVTLVAMVAVSPICSVAGLVSIPFLFFSTRRYLRYAPAGYVRERISYATMSGTVAETAEGARTVDAQRLSERQRRRVESNLRESYYSEMYTLFLRMRWFPVVEGAFGAAIAATVLWSGLLAITHPSLVSVGAVTTITLYVIQLNDPLDRIISWLDELQVGQSSLARLIGVSAVKDTRPDSGPEPVDEVISLRDVHYAYREGRDVLHGVDLVVRPGERLAMVGPSGAGKSTIGRLIAGIDGPRTGAVTVGDVALSEMPLEMLRRHVALVTQEHHIFIGTVRDNIALARPASSDEEIRRALDAVDSLDWVDALPLGLDTEIGATGHPITPAQAQQIALARLVLADPHTLVLDEATALLDPRAARHLERSLSAVLSGRTVIAIAHRLHTAHDADRVAVVADGRIVELGTHDELIERQGEYAALWRSWRNEAPAAS
jgi:ABC-type multidrug transport system fused ATPase/permease subunit